ncbi:kinase-like domain-containing protein [Suillus clintonianus]|uniref:kinase-like domain-containing protein n=1 Tax=Suillus clintonianus TaxID=1904413 RepID=UPI001B87825A|nr:kinase-like domain-containing protein [Suillus clintonianus]KAG2132083.1 kinase-like domain-containing protein [Suillus clintonianus]
MPAPGKRQFLKLIRRGQALVAGAPVDPPSASASGTSIPERLGTFNDNNGCHPVSLTASLVRKMAFHTSDYSVFEIDASNVIMETTYPTASSGLADVYKCILNRGASQEGVAVKCLRFPNTSKAEVDKTNYKLDRELSIWVILDHQYVLRLYGVVYGFGPFRAFVSPWMPNGTLDSYLDRSDLTAVSRLTLFKQIVEGLKYLHDNNVIHSNLTSLNVLVAADGSPRIAGFGISNIVIQSSPAFSYHTGGVRWAAPELLDPPEDQPVQYATKFSDIYSLGCVMLQVLYGKLPYWWLKTATHVISARFKHLEPIDTTFQIQAHHLNYMQRC